MTLREVLARSKTPPKVGDHEIVVGPDGMAHILVISHVDFENPVETHMNWDCPCRAIKTGNPMDFEVAPSITCLQCMLL
jgi:hypothetical protein